MYEYSTNYSSGRGQSCGKGQSELESLLCTNESAKMFTYKLRIRLLLGSYLPERLAQ